VTGVLRSKVAERRPDRERAAVDVGLDHRVPVLDGVLEAKADEIAVGVERAAASLASSRNAGQLRATYLCGGGSRTPGLSDILASRLRMPVEHANPLARLNIRDGALDSFVTDDVAPLLMLPIGLALRQ